MDLCISINYIWIPFSSLIINNSIFLKNCTIRNSIISTKEQLKILNKFFNIIYQYGAVMYVCVCVELKEPWKAEVDFNKYNTWIRTYVHATHLFIIYLIISDYI